MLSYRFILHPPFGVNNSIRSLKDSMIYVLKHVWQLHCINNFHTFTCWSSQHNNVFCLVYFLLRSVYWEFKIYLSSSFSDDLKLLQKCKSLRNIEVWYLIICSIIKSSYILSFIFILDRCLHKNYFLFSVQLYFHSPLIRKSSFERFFFIFIKSRNKNL